MPTKLIDDIAQGSAAAARRRLAELPPEDARDVANELAQPAADGSELALELLVEHIDRHGLVRAAVRQFLIDETAVQDVTQEVLLTVATRITSFRGDARFTTWLHTVARNRSTDRLRRERATVPLDNEDLPLSERVSSMIAGAASVDQMLEAVPDPYRQAVRMRDVEQLGYDQMTERLGVSLNTIRSRVSRGRALIAAKWHTD